MTSVSFFVVFIVENAPGGGVLNSFFARGWGIRPSKKIAGGGGDGKAWN